VPNLPVIERLPDGARVAVVRLRSLGDCVLTTPALSLLRRHRPGLRVAVVVEDRFSGVYAGNPDVDAILPPEAARLRAWRPDLCLNLHGGTRSAVLTALSGARWRCAFAHLRYPWIYNVRIPRAQRILGVERVVHTAEHVASALFFLGVPLSAIPRARLFCLSPAPAPPAPYAVLHPFASQPDKTWPAERFGELAARLEMPVTILGGPGDDLSAFADFPCLAARPLEEVKTLLSRASLFVGNDSGPAHMAAAFGVPLAVLFGSSDAAVWRPWNAPCEVLSSPSGIQSISVDQVLAAVARLRVPA
jgi:ADP-heptose:LPS heptosyltransferase